jgi:hypothetical protein
LPKTGPVTAGKAGPEPTPSEVPAMEGMDSAEMPGAKKPSPLFPRGPALPKGTAMAWVLRPVLPGDPAR